MFIRGQLSGPGEKHYAWKLSKVPFGEDSVVSRIKSSKEAKENKKRIGLLKKNLEVHIKEAKKTFDFHHINAANSIIDELFEMTLDYQKKSMLQKTKKTEKLGKKEEWQEPFETLPQDVPRSEWEEQYREFLKKQAAQQKESIGPRWAKVGEFEQKKAENAQRRTSLIKDITEELRK